MRVLVTGGCGFIGTAIVDKLLRSGAQVLNLDKLTYAAAPEALGGWTGSERYQIVEGDICDINLVLELFEDFQPDTVINCAAESHVDRSIDSAAVFLQTNFIGTYTMLEAARCWWAGRKGTHRFHQISTDEVYGALGPSDPATREKAPYAPNTPYAASKASADHLVHAWGQTYGLPVVTSHCTNNYGPWQFPEKLIPLMITNGIDGRVLPLYGAGDNIRDWLHVSDHADAVLTVLEHGDSGETYNIGGLREQRNMDVVHLICDELDARLPEDAPHHRMISHVVDRAAHDRRHAVDTSKIATQLGWQPKTDFREGLAETVEWYFENREWWRVIRETRYNGERLGLAAA